MPKTLNRNNSTISKIDQCTLYIEPRILKKNNINDGEVVELFFEDNKISIFKDNRSKFFEWMIYSVIDNYGKHFPKLTILLTTKDRIIHLAGKDVMLFEDKCLSSDFKMMISSREPTIYESIKIKPFLKDKNEYLIDLIILNKERWAIGSIMIIKNKEVVKTPDINFLYEVLRNVGNLYFKWWIWYNQWDINIIWVYT